MGHSHRDISLTPVCNINGWICFSNQMEGRLIFSVPVQIKVSLKTNVYFSSRAEAMRSLFDSSQSWTRPCWSGVTWSLCKSTLFWCVRDEERWWAQGDNPTLSQLRKERQWNLQTCFSVAIDYIFTYFYPVSGTIDSTHIISGSVCVTSTEQWLHILGTLGVQICCWQVILWLYCCFSHCLFWLWDISWLPINISYISQKLCLLRKS